MNSRFFFRASASILVLAGAAFGAPACSDATANDPKPVTTIDVPEIQASVALENFCKLYEEVRCAGSLGCCEMKTMPFANEAECLAASTCEADMAALLASPLVADGAVVYDPTLAADYLRGRAMSTSACGATKDDSSPFQVFAGSLAEGADCSANIDDVAHRYVCQSGLGCDATEDPATGVAKYTCATAVPISGTYGATCIADEDCKSGSCLSNQCGVATTALFCEPPPEPEPATNWYVSTTDVPDKLRVTAHSADSSGTNDNIILAYRNKSGTYACTITATIADGDSQECVPTQSSSSKAQTDIFYVKFASTSSSASDNGLRVTEVAANHDGTWYYVSYFNVSDMAMDCEGCSDTWEEEDCNSCWIDGDDHGSCTEMKVQMDGNAQTWCP